MFVKPSRLAVGAVVLSPIVSIAAPAAHAATIPVKNHCVINALSAPELAAGVQTAVVCFATVEQATGAVTGGGNGPVTYGIPGRFALATYYAARSGDAMAGTLMVTGDSCSDALYYTPDSWMPYMAAWAPNACSTAKHYTGANFTGTSAYASGGFVQFNAPVCRNIRSIKFA